MQRRETEQGQRWEVSRPQDVYFTWRQQEYVRGLQCTDVKDITTTMCKSRNCGAKNKQNKTSGSKLQRLRQTDKTLSPEHVQCAQEKPSVCISKHHPATIGLVQWHACLRARSVLPDFPRSPLTGTETTAHAPQSLARCLLILFLTFTCTVSSHYKWMVFCGKQEQLAFDAEQCDRDGRNSVIHIQSS